VLVLWLMTMALVLRRSRSMRVYSP
jgi:hypothetical protein